MSYISLHKTPQIQKIPIIIYTSVLERDRIIKMNNPGVKEIMAKPLKVTELQAKIASVMKGAVLFLFLPAYKGPEMRFKKR